MALVNSEEKKQSPADWSKIGTESADAKKFHIDALRARFKDLAKPNLFMVEITGPSGLSFENHGYMVKSINIPQVEIGKITLKRMGTTHNLPGDINFPDINITFWSDEDMKLRSELLRWQKYHSFNWNIKHAGLFDEIDGTKIAISQLNSEYKKVQTTVYENCWPVTVGELSYSQDTTDSRIEFNATFCYTSMDIK